MNSTPLAYASSTTKHRLFESWFHFAPLPRVNSASSASVHCPKTLVLLALGRGAEEGRRRGIGRTSGSNKIFFYLFWLTDYHMCVTKEQNRPRVSRGGGGGGGVICPLCKVDGFKMLCIVIQGVNWMSAKNHRVIQSFSDKFLYYIESSQNVYH